MKILISGSKTEGGLPSSFAEAFRMLGCQVVIFDDEALFNKMCPFKNRVSYRLLWQLVSLKIQKYFINKINAEKPDVILIFKGFYFNPKTINYVKKEFPDISLFNFNPDNPFNTWHFFNSNRWIRNALTIYDVYFTWGKFLIKDLNKVGVKKTEYLPWAHDPSLHYPVNPTFEEKEKYGGEIVFIGSWDEEREWWLNRIFNYPFVIWGNAWHKANPKIRSRWKGLEAVGKEFSMVCNSSKIVLNLIRRQNTPAHNMRTFEIPACKGFQLATRTDEQMEFFEEDKEIVCFSTVKELKEKLDFYLSKKIVRAEISERAFKKVQKHTYYERANKVLEIHTAINSTKGL